jgi:hydroxymethylpyrimidine pyrophosphatase-like HAD family hydrolase
MTGVTCVNPEKTARLEEKYKDCKLLHFSPSSRLIFVHKDAGKLATLKVIAEMEHISLAEIAAFGDDYPDMEMLKECGIGVAMGNGLDEVKAIADHVCQSNDDDGVAKWIEENILEERKV